MKIQFVVFFFLIFFSCTVKADDVVKRIGIIDSARVAQISQINNAFYVELQADSIALGNEHRKVKFKRGKAIIFTLFTGIFGGHRIYFGTHQRTPIIYSITFGGLGILPLIDLFHIIFTKDLSKFEHKSQIIMWGR